MQETDCTLSKRNNCVCSH